MTTRKILTALCMTLTAVVLFATTAAAQMPQTTTEKTKGTAAVNTQELKGEVMYVEGNDLVVKLAGGEMRTFRVPETRKFIVDGKELSVHQLKEGTWLTATVTTTATPVTVRTTTVGGGTVWYVAGNTVILTLPNGENRLYVVKDDVKFIVNDKPATVFELKKGMKVSAEKIVEEPLTEIATDTKVVGQTTPMVASMKTATAAPAAPAPAQPMLPKTASSVPLLGYLGVAFLLTGIALAWRRRLV